MTRSPRYTRCVPQLQSLHRLPVWCRMVIKICIISYQTLSYKQPSYLHSLLTPVRKPVQLRSSSSDIRLVPKVTHRDNIILVSSPQSPEVARSLAMYRDPLTGPMLILGLVFFCTTCFLLTDDNEYNICIMYFYWEDT